MKIEETREAMVAAIRSVDIAGKDYDGYVEELCDRLMSLGAFVPPVKKGDTVWAYLPEILGEEPSVEPWEVAGYGIDCEGDLYAEAKDREQYPIGTTYCYLTREEAAEAMEKGKTLEADGDE